LTSFVKDGEIKATVARWEKAQGLYYSTLYDRPLSVAVTGEGVGVLVKAYVDRTVPADVTNLGSAAITTIVLTDVEQVLDRAFVNEVTSRFRSVGGFIENLLLRKVDKVEINERRLQSTVEQESCRIIPCNPKECDPDTCVRRSKERAFPGRR